MRKVFLENSSDSSIPLAKLFEQIAGVVITMLAKQPAARDVTIEIRKGRQGDQACFDWTARGLSQPSAPDAAVMAHALEVLLTA